MEEDAIEIAKIIVRVDDMAKKIETVCSKVDDLQRVRDNMEGSWQTIKWMVGLIGISQLVGIISIWLR